jgi:hypothetical protein
MLYASTNVNQALKTMLIVDATNTGIIISLD